jgi:hypothetical protein
MTDVHWRRKDAGSGWVRETRLQTLLAGTAVMTVAVAAAGWGLGFW